MKIKWLVAGFSLAANLFVACAQGPVSSVVSPPPESPKHLEKVKFGSLPYGDHSQAIIGIEKGWFREAGIELEHEVIKIENVVSFLKNGTLDVCSTPAAILFPAYDDAPGLIMIAFADIFQGFAIVSQPELKCKSYQEFRKEGKTPKEAFTAAMNQLKGKTFAYPSETSVKPFIDNALTMGGLGREDFKSLVQDDTLNINAMRQKRADFQVGGAPSRIALQKEGFKPIVTALDLAENAKPSRLSPELASVFPDGWATTKRFYETKHDTILRLASVSFRINEFIVNSPEDALKIHMPFLSHITGEKFNTKDGMFIYKELDPFYTFEDQRAWFHETNSPFFYLHINGAGLQSFVQKWVFRGKTPEIEEFVFADDIYREMEQLKKSAEGKIAALSGEAKLSREDKVRLDKAKQYFATYNYLDADRLLSSKAK
jgi:ABC-type nitrate/sulfonate/bicarbonate transport system substrate-binding protein